MKRQSIFIISILLICCNVIFSEERLSSFEDLLNQPNIYINTPVYLEGVIQQILNNSSKTTISFILEGDDGIPITVNSQYERPLKGERYKIDGLFYIDRYTSQPLISEKRREIVIMDKAYEAIPGTVNKQPIKVEGNIRSIITNPDNYNMEFVIISGVVEKLHPDNRWFTLRGDYGKVIDVNIWDDLPAINTTIEREGVIYLTIDGKPFLSEIKSLEIKNTKKLSQSFSKLNHTSDQLADKKAIDNFTFGIIGFLVIMLVVFVYLYFTKKKKVYSSSSSSTSSTTQRKSSKPSLSENDLNKTLKVTVPSKTAKVIPGELTIVSDAPDKGAKYPLLGEGQIVKIGRDINNHIKIADREEYRTISRKQAVFIEKDGKVYIRNESKTNKTKVNGKEVADDEERVLNDGDKITMGVLEMVFNSNN